MRKLAQLLRYPLFVVLLLSATTATAAPQSQTIGAESWNDWVYERYQILTSVSGEERTELRQSLYIVKEHWMEAHGYAIYARTPERLEAYVQWLQGRTLQSLVTLAAELRNGDTEAAQKLSMAEES